MPIKQSQDAQQQLQRLTQIIWQTRPDLQSLFKKAASEAFQMWLLMHGRNEYQGLAEALENVSLTVLEQPDEKALSQTTPYLTRFMRGIWQSRPDLQATFNVEQPADQHAFIRWFFLFGIHEHNLENFLTQAQVTWLLSSAFSDYHLPNALMLIWEQDPALEQQYVSPKSPEFLNWARQHGRQQYPLLETIAIQAERLQAAPAKQSTPRAARPFGVNLIGYANGQFGIGEDVRMAALACEAADIPFSIYNVAPGKEVDLAASQADQHVSEQLPYSINVFCTTGIETARLAAVEGQKLFKGYYCIGYWPWELPQWPDAWHLAYDYIDEVWASSRFAYHAYIGSSPKPVRHMPMAVNVDASANKTRQGFGLPESSYLFVFSFDFLSSVKRKNPQACIDAFSSAFPCGNEPVGLVVKAMRAEDDNPQWQALNALAQQDPRIHIINETLTRGEVLDLYRACDCFVSLHRSEGFGRGIADAMLLGKPVITTGYSGNLDFTMPATAALVDHQLQTLTKDDYPFGEGQQWAEPNVEHAAWWMRRLLNQPNLARALATQGQQLIQNAYTPTPVGEYYRAVLETL
ncbi:MAG: hypothetical protein XD36_2685 [Halomonas sp. 54_146]|nr:MULTISPECIES: glycosyltransferase family 4 protein [unclassified Halomonas]KUJ86889.1 MAG: hypothetical protein XD36_2685 [Halomonas sp. 54_146]